MNKPAFVKVGFEVWYTGPNTPEAIDHLHGSILADMDTWRQWVQIEAVETEDASSGDVPEWLWECIEEPCPCLDEEGHGTSCARCEGRETVVPGWEEPSPRPTQPDPLHIPTLIDQLRDWADALERGEEIEGIVAGIREVAADIEADDIEHNRKENE